MRSDLSAIPHIGGPALELFNAVIAPPIERRRNEWLNDLAERLNVLEQEEQLKMEDLAANEQFVSTVMQATTCAMRNHHREKLEALRNAVLNMALGRNHDDTKREMFLAFVDQFTVLHLQVLKALSDFGLRQGPKTSIDEIAKVAMKQVADLRRQEALAEMVVDELCRRGLLFWSRDGRTMHISHDTRQVTELGEEFLRFISDPQKP
jgi:hypothetical protein